MCDIAFEREGKRFTFARISTQKDLRANPEIGLDFTLDFLTTFRDYASHCRVNVTDWRLLRTRKRFAHFPVLYVCFFFLLLFTSRTWQSFCNKRRSVSRTSSRGRTLRIGAGTQ